MWIKGGNRIWGNDKAAPVSTVIRPLIQSMVIETEILIGRPSKRDRHSRSIPLVPTSRCSTQRRDFGRTDRFAEFNNGRIESLCAYAHPVRVPEDDRFKL